MANEGKTEARFVILDPPCAYCKHLTKMGFGDENNFEGWTCRAFPSGIPYSILTRTVPHTEPWPLIQKGELSFESKIFEFEDGKMKITFNGDWVFVS